MDVVVRPIEKDDVAAASLVVQGGSLTPDVEDERAVDKY
jgi:hypothetical protein